MSQTKTQHQQMNKKNFKTIYNDLNIKFRRDFQIFINTTKLDDFLQKLKNKKKIWWTITNKNQARSCYTNNAKKNQINNKSYHDNDKKNNYNNINYNDNDYNQNFYNNFSRFYSKSD